MKYSEAMDSQLEKRSVNVLERRWTAVVDRMFVFQYGAMERKEMGGESRETGTCASGKLLEPGL